MNKTIFRFIIIIYLMSKIYNSAVNQKKKKKLIKFDKKEYWCELLHVSNISYKPWANLTWTSSAMPVF